MNEINSGEAFEINVTDMLTGRCARLSVYPQNTMGQVAEKAAEIMSIKYEANGEMVRNCKNGETRTDFSATMHEFGICRECNAIDICFYRIGPA